MTEQQQGDRAPEQGLDEGVVVSADAGTVAAVDADEAIEQAEAESDGGEEAGPT